MKIVICSSISFTHKIKEVADILSNKGHEVEIPFYANRILNGHISLEEFLSVKEERGDIGFRQESEEDLIKRYFRLIKDSDAILVLNLDKNNQKNYIGGNTFLEMGFAHILDKEIFLFNPIPEIGYKDEIIAMNPVIIDGDLDKISL